MELKGYFLGVMHGKGKGKSGNDYDFCQLRLLEKAEGFENEKNKFDESGFKEVAYPLTRDAFQLIKDRVVVPDKLELVKVLTEAQKNQWGKLEAVVVGLGK